MNGLGKCSRLASCTKWLNVTETCQQCVGGSGRQLPAPFNCQVQAHSKPRTGFNQGCGFTRQLWQSKERVKGIEDAWKRVILIIDNKIFFKLSIENMFK